MTRALEQVLELHAALASPTRLERWTQAVQQVGELSREMSAFAVHSVFEQTTENALRSFVNTRPLHGCVGLRLARSVPTSVLRAVSLVLLRGAKSVCVSAPSSLRPVLDVVVDTLPTDVNVTVMTSAASLQVFDMHECASVLAWGSDNTVNSLRDSAVSNVFRVLQSVELRGHGQAMALVQHPSTAALDALAQDVALFEQSGCLSPRTVWLRGDVDAAQGFANRLADAMERLAVHWPRPALSPSRAHAVMQWQGVMASVSDHFVRRASCAVAVVSHDALSTLPATPGERNIVVVAAQSADQCVDAIRLERPSLTVVGTDDVDAVSAWLGQGPRVRATSLGSMQLPPWSEYEDPREPMCVTTRR